jgi:lipoprotein
MKVRSCFAALVAAFMIAGVAGCDTEDALVIPDEKVDENNTPDVGDDSAGDESDDENVIPGEDENPGEEPSPGEGEEDDGGYNTDGPFVPPVITDPLSPDIRPTLVVGKRWEYVREKIFPDHYDQDKYDEPFTLKCTRDSVFDGYEGKVIRIVEKNGQSVPQDEIHSIEFFYREDGPVVYHLEDVGGYMNPIWEFQKHWWYDPSAGMEFRSLHGWECVVSRGTIVLQGVERRALKIWTYKFLTKVTPRYDYWVEGIGSLFGHNTIYDDYHWKQYNTDKLLKCYEGDKLIYDSREFREELYTPTEVYSDIDKQQQ